MAESLEVNTALLIQTKQRQKISDTSSFISRVNTKLRNSNILEKSNQDTPLRVFIVRHGHSLSNQDPKVLQVCSDHTIPLSDKGRQQALNCGEFLEQQIQESEKNRKYALWVSPYKRARETAEVIEQKIGSHITKRRESIFLGEQQFGLFEGLPLSELSKKYPYENTHFEKAIEYGGRFWARMPLGESRFDVAVRLKIVIDSITKDYNDSGITDVIIVTHGVTARVLTMMLLENTPEWLEVEPNPKNCSIRLIEGPKDAGYIFEGFTHSCGKRSRQPSAIPNIDKEETSDGSCDDSDECDGPPKKKQRASISDLSKDWVTPSEDRNFLSTLVSNIARMEEELKGLKARAIEAIERTNGK